jgi:CheY-like chemotaxis protein
MPDGMNGAELAGAIRSQPQLAATRLILLTSMGQAAKPAEVGVDGSLTKPVNASQLHDEIAAVLARAAASENGAPTAAPVPETVDTSDAPHAGARVLVAEDHPVNRLLAVKLLERLGCSVDVAQNGAEAVDMSNGSEYAAIFMDCQMPEVDGYEATGRIRRREADGGEHVPIVAMTANTMEGDRERCIDAGMDDYLPKPLRPAELEGALRRALNGGENQVPLVDHELLQDVLDEAGREAGLATMFLEESRKRLGRLRAAIESGADDEVAAVAHSVKGSAASFGATRMAALAHEIEQGIGNGRDELMELHTELERTFARTETELEP